MAARTVCTSTSGSHKAVQVRTLSATRITFQNYSVILCSFVVSTGLPVMVYFFGGGYLVGGSQGANFLDNYLYSGEEIADRGNVIVVTVNYRVGSLGFLSTGDSELPGENQRLDDVYACFYTTIRTGPLICLANRHFKSAYISSNHTKTFHFMYRSIFICVLHVKSHFLVRN